MIIRSFVAASKQWTAASRCLSTRTSLIEETEDDHHVMLGPSSEETKSMHELGALRALICQLEIPDLFEALDDVRLSL